MREIRKTIPAGGEEFVDAAGDFIFCSFADRPFIITNEGQPVTMRVGGKYRPHKRIQNFMIKNTDTANEMVVILVVGEGDFNNQIVQGEVTVSPGVRGADGVFRDDTRTVLEMDIYPYRSNAVVIAQNTRRAVIDDFRRHYPSVIGAEFLSKPNVGTVGGELGSRGLFIVFAKGADVDQFGVNTSFGRIWFVDSRLNIVSITELGNGNVPNNSQGSMCVYNGTAFGVGDASTDAEARTVYNAETGVEIFTPTGFAAPRICATPDGILVGVDGAEDHWWLINENGDLLNDGPLPAGGFGRAVWSEYHQAMASQYGNKVRVFPGWFDSSAEGMLELGGNAPLGQMDGSGFAMFGEMVVTQADTNHEPTISSSSILATQLEDVISPAGVEVVPKGCGLGAFSWQHYEGGQTDADIKVLGVSPNTILMGELIRYCLERWFNGRVGDSYLDHVYFVELPSPENVGARTQKSSGGRSFKALQIPDNFIARFPGRVKITVDNELPVTGQGSL